MPRRAHARRKDGLSALQARVDAIAGKRPCVATYIRDADGEPFMGLMLCASGCEPCREFRAAVAKNQAAREAARPKPTIPESSWARRACGRGPEG